MTNDNYGIFRCPACKRMIIRTRPLVEAFTEAWERGQSSDTVEICDPCYKALAEIVEQLSECRNC